MRREELLRAASDDVQQILKYTQPQLISFAHMHVTEWSFDRAQSQQAIKSTRYNCRFKVASKQHAHVRNANTNSIGVWWSYRRKRRKWQDQRRRMATQAATATPAATKRQAPTAQSAALAVATVVATYLRAARLNQPLSRFLNKFMRIFGAL
jgi:hypothetical protein